MQVAADFDAQAFPHLAHSQRVEASDPDETRDLCRRLGVVRRVEEDGSLGVRRAAEDKSGADSVPNALAYLVPLWSQLLTTSPAAWPRAAFARPFRP